MKTNYSIDDHLQKSMDKFEIQPRISSFDAVMQKLEKKRRRRFFMIFFFGVLASFLGSLVILNFSQGEELIGDSKNLTLVTKIPGSKKEFTAKQKVTNNHRTDKQIDRFQKDSKTKKEKSTSSANVQKKTGRKNNYKTIAAVPLKVALTIQSIRGSDSQVEPDKNDYPISDSLNSQEIPFVFLEQKYLTLPDNNHVSEELITTVTMALPVEFSQKSDTLVKNKKRVKFMLGLNANPQLSSYQFSDNKHHDAIYDNSAGESFSKLYLENRKKQNSFKFNYAFGIKFGFNVDDKWELWFAGGIQRYTYSERLYSFAVPSSNTAVGPSGISYNNAPPSSYYENGFKNSFSYISYGLEFNRIVKPNPFLKLKFGLGLKANSLLKASYIFVKSPDAYYLSDSYNNKYLSKWMYTTNLNMGIIKDLTKRLQLRLSPGIFYSPTSMFSKSYAVKQNSFGLELECLLILKLF